MVESKLGLFRDLSRKFDKIIENKTFKDFDCLIENVNNSVVSYTKKKFIDCFKVLNFRKKMKTSDS